MATPAEQRILKRRAQLLEMKRKGYTDDFIKFAFFANDPTSDITGDLETINTLTGQTQDNRVEVGGRKFDVNTITEQKTYQELKAGENQQVTMKENAKTDLSTKLSTLDELLQDQEGLSAAVGANPLARPFTPISGAKQRFAGKLESILSTDTLDALINAKAEGATFGALSDAELNLLRASASTLAQWAVKDKDGKIVGFDASEEDVKKELGNLRTTTAKAFEDINTETTGATTQAKPKVSDPAAVQAWLDANPTDPRAEQVRKLLEEQNRPLGDNAALESGAGAQPVEDKSGFLSDVAKSASERFDKGAAALNTTDSNASKVLQVTGQELGFVADVAGAAIVNTLKTLSPKWLEKKTGEKVSELISAGMDTDVAKKAVGEWEGFKKSNPEFARNIEATGNIANFFALGYGGGKAATTTATTTGKVAQKTGTVIAGSGDDAARVAKESFSQELVMPFADKATKTAQVGRTTEKGFGPFKRNVVTPTAAEKRMAEEAMKVSGVSPSNTLQQNYNAIQGAVSAEADDLITRLSANDFIVSKKETLSRLKQASAKLKENPLIVGESEKMAEKLIAGAQRFINEHGGTGSGLLKARKAYDAWVLKQKPKAFDAKAENAFTSANREVRGAINQLLDEKAPSVGVKESLRKQSTLLNAMDNIAPKAAKEADTAIGRAVNNLFSAVNVESELSKKIISTGAVAGTLIGGAVAPGVVAGAVGVGITAKLVKALKNPKLRQEFGRLLKAAGDKLNPGEKAMLEELIK